ncbi:MAG: Hsp20 family protein [Pseudomonadota bacterium]
MRHVDYTPFYRSTVGFDRLFNMLDSLAQPENGQTYPPYNIERLDENAYRITMAVAGFGDEDISIEARANQLTIAGGKADENTDGKTEYLHRGIASRSFERRFHLADHVEVRHAELENGLLHIDLVRELPEAMKPRKIAINAKATASKQIEAKAKKSN